MTDEVAQLRTDLGAGRYERLCDPLLAVLLLGDPGDWWRGARRACAESLRQYLEVSPWRIALDPAGDMAITQVRLAIDDGRLAPYLEPYVRVLEQWPG